jgi:16S rRNA (adenine1518-N6/adenine1519-N6)-dimethyltransferase
VIRKRFGQHFLEPAWVDKVVAAIAPQPNETFLEIGAGRGALTLPLALRAKSVVAFEIDRDLASELQKRAPSNVRIIAEDFLEAGPSLPIFNHGEWGPTHRHPIAQSPRAGDPALRSHSPASRLARASGAPSPATRVVGNLPYYVASPILFKLSDLFSSGHHFADATLMLQQEVVDRLIANPGGRTYGVLSILIQHVSNIEPLLALPPGAFRPSPQVRSGLIRVRFHAPDPPVSDRALFTLIVQSVFTRRRKTLANALLTLDQRDLASNSAPRLRPKEALTRAGLDGTRRPETLTLQEFARLAEVYASDSQ